MWVLASHAQISGVLGLPGICDLRRSGFVFSAQVHSTGPFMMETGSPDRDATSVRLSGVFIALVSWPLGETASCPLRCSLRPPETGMLKLAWVRRAWLPQLLEFSEGLAGPPLSQRALTPHSWPSSAHLFLHGQPLRGKGDPTVLRCFYTLSSPGGCSQRDVTRPSERAAQQLVR